MMIKPNRVSRRRAEDERPEGPYELGDGQSADQRAIRDEQVRFVDFVAQIYDEAETLLGPTGSQREMRMILHLIASHFDGHLVTSSSLAAASGLTYGTALRTIEDLRERGLIVLRARTASGRSQLPSAEAEPALTPQRRREEAPPDGHVVGRVPARMWTTSDRS